MELLNTFGLDIKILVAQFLTFAVFFFVLYKYAIVPITDFLNKRKESIRKSLEDAEIAKTSVEKAEETRESILEDAKKEAKNIISHAEEQANISTLQITEKAKQDALEITKKSELNLKRKEEMIIQNAQNKIGDLVLQLTKKVLKQNVDEQTNQKYINETLTSINNHSENNG